MSNIAVTKHRERNRVERNQQFCHHNKRPTFHMKKVWETRGNLVMKLVSSLFQINFKSVRTPHLWTAFPKNLRLPN